MQSFDLGDHLLLASFVVNSVNLIVIPVSAVHLFYSSMCNLTLNSGRTLWTGFFTQVWVT